MIAPILALDLASVAGWCVGEPGGVDTIGMTAATEAKLCREAELCFSALALVTDFDSWHEDEAPVTTEAVVATLLANVARARDVVRHLLPIVQGARPCACGGTGP